MTTGPNIVTFFTVCGGGEEYEFLLGSIEHHAKLGKHFVLDVSLDSREFKVPESVRWAQRPFYGSGDWKTFRLATAMEDARAMALEVFPETEFLVYLDCDEYYDVDLLREAFSVNREITRAFIFDTIHWKGGLPLKFGPSEAHLRAWDVRAPYRIVQNISWQSSPYYNGNPEHHPVLSAFHGPSSIPVEIVAIQRPAHYHVHYDLGRKSLDDQTAKTTIDGWPNGTPVESPCSWPEPLLLWKERGALPSQKFS